LLSLCERSKHIHRPKIRRLFSDTEIVARNQDARRRPQDAGRRLTKSAPSSQKVSLPEAQPSRSRGISPGHLARSAPRLVALNEEATGLDMHVILREVALRYAAE
jgi:hypothetical protein